MSVILFIYIIVELMCMCCGFADILGCLLLLVFFKLHFTVDFISREMLNEVHEHVYANCASFIRIW